MDWISGRKARERLGATVTELFKLAARGLIQIKALPGEAIKYSAADIERMVAQKKTGGGDA